jgi:hypothetical protein
MSDQPKIDERRGNLPVSAYVARERFRGFMMHYRGGMPPEGSYGAGYLDGVAVALAAAREALSYHHAEDDLLGPETWAGGRAEKVALGRAPVSRGQMAYPDDVPSEPPRRPDPRERHS